MRFIAAFTAALLTAGCASVAEPMTKPASGYPALRFSETTRLPQGVLGGAFEARAGTVLLGDRRMPDGEPLFCGDVAFVDDILGRSARPSFVCFAYRRGKLLTNADRGASETYANSIPPGVIEEFRLR